MLIALTDGELDWDEAIGDFRRSEATPLPIPLKNRFAVEPRWIDLRPYRDGSVPNGAEFVGLSADFAAAIRGIPKEDLLSEEVRQQRRARTLAGTAVATLIALLLAAGWEWNQARLQRDEAELQHDKARADLLARRADAETVTPEDIERAGALALESIWLARKSNRPEEADAVEAVRSALIRLPLAVLALREPGQVSGGATGWTAGQRRRRRQDQALAEGRYRRAGGPLARQHDCVPAGACGRPAG